MRSFTRLLIIAGVLVVLQSLVQPVFAALDLPILTGRVVDKAGLLNSSQKRQISKQLKEHETATSNQVVVVTLRSLQGTTIEDYGYQLGRHWGIGQAERDNGVLLIVVPNERKVRIEVGYGLEGDLPDTTAKVIIEWHILPVFRKGDYATGIAIGVDKILAVIEGSYEPKAESWKSLSAYLPVVLFVVLLVIILVLYARGVGQNECDRSYHIPGSRSGHLNRNNGSGSSGGGFSGGGGSFGGGGSSGSW